MWEDLKATTKERDEIQTQLNEMSSQRNQLAQRVTVALADVATFRTGFITCAKLEDSVPNEVHNDLKARMASTERELESYTLAKECVKWRCPITNRNTKLLVTNTDPFEPIRCRCLNSV